MIFLAML
jgi:hypothetical protein